MSSTNSNLAIYGTGVTRALILMIISGIMIPCAAARKGVENITLLDQRGVVGVWRWNDKMKYNPPSDFRNESARNYYDIWPEDNPGCSFKFPCEDSMSWLMLSNFTYTMNGGLVQSLQYYDLEIVYRYRPYWRKPKDTCFGCAKDLVGFPAIYCERGDLTMLEFFRARKTVLQGVQSSLGMVAIQQMAFGILVLVISVSLLNFRKWMKLIIDKAQGNAQLTISNDKHREMLIGQVVVCVVMVEYLYLSYLQFMIHVVFGVVTVAITFSMSIIISVGCKSLRYMVKPLWRKMKARIATFMAHVPAAAAPPPQPGSSATQNGPSIP